MQDLFQHILLLNVEGEVKVAVNKHTGWGQTFYLRDTTDDTKMAKDLDLTAEQKEKIVAIYTDFWQKRKEGERPTREQMRADFEKLEQQVNAVLTDSQKKKYEEMKKARPGRRQ